MNKIFPLTQEKWNEFYSKVANEYQPICNSPDADILFEDNLLKVLPQVSLQMKKDAQRKEIESQMSNETYTNIRILSILKSSHLDVIDTENGRIYTNESVSWSFSYDSSRKVLTTKFQSQCLRDIEKYVDVEMDLFGYPETEIITRGNKHTLHNRYTLEHTYILNSSHDLLLEYLSLI